MNLVKRPRLRSNSGASKLIGAIITVGLIGMAWPGQAHAAERIPAPVATAVAADEPSTYYLVPDPPNSVDRDATADCLLNLGWTGHAGDNKEAIYAPTFVIAACKRAPVGMVPVSTDDVSPAVWAQLLAFGYHGDPTDGTDDVLYATAGVSGALNRIDAGLNR